MKISLTLVISPVLGMPYRLTRQDVIDIPTSEGYAHDHTSGDHMEHQYADGTVATVLGAGKLRQECSTRTVKD